MKFLGIIVLSLCTFEMLHGRPINYNLSCECPGHQQVQLIQTVSLGKKLFGVSDKYFSPTIMIAVDPVQCSQQKTYVFTLKYGKEKLGDLIFGSQICTLDPIFKCCSEKYDVYLSQEGGIHDFKLYIEKKV